MVCPYCQSGTDVINSRPQKRNNQIWRRRHCQGCDAIFTTHEQISLTSTFLVKTGEAVRPFSPDKLFSDILKTLGEREDAYEAARELSATITLKVTKNARESLILPQMISSETAGVLKRFNKQAYLRYLAEHPSLQA